MSKTWKISEGDLVRSVTNTGYTLLENTDKTKQDVRMCLSTDTRESTNLGCGLDDAIGSDNDNPASAYATSPAAFEFQSKLRAGLNRLKSAQRSFQFSERSAKELIYDFGPVQIWSNSLDARDLRWKVDVITVDGRSNFSISGNIRG